MADDSTVQWAVELAVEDHDALASLRLRPGLQVLALRDAIWLSGSQADDVPSRWLACLPCQARYACDPDGRLTPLGGRVPVARLPAGDWRPISMFLVPQVPPAALPGQLVRQCRIRLQPSSDVREPGALLTTPAALLTWAETASAVRLGALRFALCGDQRLLLVGTPVPPIRGREYTLHKQVLLPAGYEFDPPALRDLVPGMLSLTGKDVVLFHPDGGGERIRETDFAAATRSAVRLTMEAGQ